MPARRLTSLARQSHYTPARYAPPAAAPTMGPTTRSLPAAVVRRMENARRAPVRQTTPLMQAPVANPQRQPNGVTVVSGGGGRGRTIRARVWPWSGWGGWPYYGGWPGYGYGGYPGYGYGGQWPWSTTAPTLAVTPWGYGPYYGSNYPGYMWPGWGGGPGYQYNYYGPGYGWP